MAIKVFNIEIDELYVNGRKKRYITTKDNTTLWADYFDYTKLPDGTYSIAADQSLSSSALPSVLTIPATFNNISVSCIGEKAFKYKSNFTVKIQDGVKSIGAEAFYDCDKMTIYLPPSVNSIGEDAFSECNGLKVYITDDIMAWHNMECANFAARPNNTYASVYILDSQGNEVTKLVIPNEITKIESFEFQNMVNIQRLVIPNSVTDIGMDAFSGCSSLADVVVGDSVKYIGVPGGFGSVFEDCSNLSTIIIGSSVKGIYADTFKGCSSLKTVYYKGTEEQWNNITISEGNTALTSATRYYYSEEPTDDGNYWCYVDGIPVVGGAECAKNGHTWQEATCTEPKICTTCGSVSTPPLGHDWVEATCTEPNTCARCGATEGEALGHDWGEWITHEEAGKQSRECSRCGHIEERIPFIFNDLGDGTCEISANTQLEGDITIPYSNGNGLIVTKIADEGFKGQTKITNITLPSTLEEIGVNAFNTCRGLSGIRIPDKVHTIDTAAFRGCSNLRYVMGCKGLKQMGTDPFMLCNNLRHLYCSCTSSEWNPIYDALYYVPRSYYSATPPASDDHTSYWHYSTYDWYDCPAMLWGTHNDSFEVVQGNYEGHNLIRLKEDYTLEGKVVLPPVLDNKRIYGLADYALYRNYIQQTQLKDVIIPDSYSRIGASAFAYCYMMGVLNIPESITYIGKGAFAYTSPVELYFEHSKNLQGMWHTQWDEYASPNRFHWNSTFASEYTIKTLDNGTYSVTGTTALLTDTNISIPSSYNGVDITAIGDNAFVGAMATSAMIGANITSIGTLAFSGTKCQAIKIPIGVTEIKPLAFSDSENLVLYVEASHIPPTKLLKL